MMKQKSHGGKGKTLTDLRLGQTSHILTDYIHYHIRNSTEASLRTSNVKHTCKVDVPKCVNCERPDQPVTVASTIHGQLASRTPATLELKTCPSGDYTPPPRSTSNSNANARSVICLFNNLNHFEKGSSLNTRTPPKIPTLDDFLVPRFRKEQQLNQKYNKQNQSAQKPQISTQTSRKRQTNETDFPFKSTSSGNFKVNANQVVYESNQISVLVAEPERTHVKISNLKNSCKTSDLSKHARITMQKEDFSKNSAINAIMKQQGLGLGSSLGSLLMGRIADAPIRKEKESTEYENKATNEILEPELNLNRLGYNSCEHVDWNEVILPEKKNLYLELYARITNFTNADCKVYIDNEEFNCHLLVLQCYSEVFHTYVAVKKVELPSDKCSPSSFAFIYEWMITGDPSYRELNRENVLDIFNAAKYLKIKDLIEQCWAFIDNPRVFCEDTAFLLYIDAKDKNLPEVRDLMLPRIEKFFLMLVSSEDWLGLEVEDVMAFLQSNYICVNCEMEVFMSAVRWLKHDWENRDKFKHQVLSSVRFGNIAPWQLVDIKRNPDNPEFRDLAKDPEICKMIDDGLAFVIIKYWYGQENDDYQHWNSILALKEPPTRNWSGTEKTYFTYREFLIYLDVYRRNLMILKNNKLSDDKTKLDISISPRSSMERLDKINTAKVPTMDEFMRGSGSKSGPGTKNKARTHYRCAKLLPSTPPLTPYQRIIQTAFRCRKEPTRKEAVCIIERAYLKYKLRSKIEGLSRRLLIQRPRRKRDRSLAKRVLESSSEKSSTSSPQHFENDQFVIRVTCGGRKNYITETSPLTNIRRRQYLCDGSLFHMEHESVLVIGGINVHAKYGTGRNTGKDIYRYLPSQNHWEFVGEMPAPRTHHCVAYLMGRIYVVGGSDPREDDFKGKFIVVDTVWSFDPVKRVWFNEGSLNLKRKNFGLVVFGKFMYAIGGQDKNSRVTDTMERYNPLKGIWEYQAPMRHPRMGVACAKFEEKIWVGGGMCGSSQKPLTDFMECYNVETNQWTEITRLRVPRCFATFVAMSNNLYIIAGAGSNRSQVHANNTVSFSTVDIWCKETKSWKEHAEMEVARHGHTTAYLGTQILIIGGVTTVYMRSLSSIECFCTTRSTWIRGMASLPTCLTGHATCTLPPAMLL